MNTVSVLTKRKDEVVDITDLLVDVVRSAEHESGICLVFAAHTTCAVTTADLDPGTDLDFLQALRKLFPPMSYRHPHDPQHAPDHILASLIGPSVTLPYTQRRLPLAV